MGKQVSSGTDQAKRLVSGTFGATGVSGAASNPFLNDGALLPPVFNGNFNIALWGTFVATVQLERSFDGGVTWTAVSEDTTGTAAAFTGVVNLVVNEPELGVQYRWNCTAYTSGTVNYRISQ